MAGADDLQAIHAWYEEYQRQQQAEIEEERRDAVRGLLLRLLRVRYGELPAAAVARVEAAEMADMERWVDRLLFAPTLAEVLDEPS